MPNQAFWNNASTLADRQPKTDRLILSRFLNSAAKAPNLDEDAIAAAHKILVHWADLETKKRLDKLKETQLQGDFLAQVFGQALGYVQPIEGADVWNQIQHHGIAPNQTPDAVLGKFTADEKNVLAVVELKGPKTHLDRDRSAGRTAVDQCWDYLVNTPPTCRWAIVSNMISFRLYERDSTKRAYEHFTLQQLRDLTEFKRFYVLFHRMGLVEGIGSEPPRARALLKQSSERQREVGDQLYDSYAENRYRLVGELIRDGRSPEQAVEMAQRLFDRVIFIAFCEDRQLLPEKTLDKAYSASGFYAVTNPRWQNFKNLFRFVDQGSETHDIPKYNGGLFAKHLVDDLELPDVPYANFFNQLGTFDFRDEVNLDVLGRLFERSITELEKIKETGLLLAAPEKRDAYATMPQSVKRKQLGIYYTPPELTSRIVQYTVEELIRERFAAVAMEMGTPKAEAERGENPDTLDYWRRCYGVLADLKIVDPACGSGAFLFQAYNALDLRYHEVVGHLDSLDAKEAKDLGEGIAHSILTKNLYGVDLSPEAVEITQLALWIRSATPGQTLASLAKNIVHGNSLVHDPAVDANGFDWKTRFPEVFDRPESGFDCVIGNPPWERIKLQEREFFSLPAPEIATATNAAKRRLLVAKLESEDPGLYKRYQEALETADKLLTYCRKSDAYPLTGRGDINLYAVFAELAYNLVAPHGRVGLLTPSGIASDMTTKDFFAAVAESNRLIRLYDFENKKVFFEEVHASFKFCVINFGGSATGQSKADFVFFAHSVEELEDSKRHVNLSGADIKLLNPNTRTCPIFRTKRDAEITKGIYRRVPVLIDHNRTGPTGNPWGVSFKRMFDQTNDAELFREAESLKKDGFKLTGNRWSKGKETYLPLYEAKMFRPYDHRHGTVFEESSNWINQGQTTESTQTEHQNPEHLVQPRFWISEDEVTRVASARPSLLAFRDITRSTDVRTFLASMLPFVGAINTAPLVLFEDVEPRKQACLLGCFNSIALDFVAKGKVGHIHMNFFIVEQLPVLSPDAYDKPCPWKPKEKLEKWISERVLKLTCTAEDMLPLADACDFKTGSFKKEYGGRLNKWDDAERAELMAELDAAYFHLYGISRDDAQYILSTFKGIHDKNPLFSDSRSTADHILSLYDEMS